jgi:hypothetical protein
VQLILMPPSLFYDISNSLGFISQRVLQIWSSQKLSHCYVENFIWEKAKIVWKNMNLNDIYVSKIFHFTVACWDFQCENTLYKNEMFL